MPREGRAWVASFTPETLKGTSNCALLPTTRATHILVARPTGWEDFDQASFLPPAVKSKLPSVKYVRRGAPANVTRLTGYDRTSYNGHSAKAMPGVNVRDVHGVFGGWSASDYTSTVSDAATLAYEVYGPQHRIIDAAHVAVRHPPRP